MPSSPVPIEEAAKCPKCGKEGKIKQAVRNAMDTMTGKRTGDDVVVYICDTEICTWYNTGWVVQSDKNGNVYERNHGPRGIDKQFPAMTPDQLSRGRAEVEDIIRREHNKNEEL